MKRFGKAFRPIKHKSGSKARWPASSLVLQISYFHIHAHDIKRCHELYRVLDRGLKHTRGFPQRIAAAHTDDYQKVIGLRQRAVADIDDSAGMAAATQRTISSITCSDT